MHRPLSVLSMGSLHLRRMHPSRKAAANIHSAWGEGAPQGRMRGLKAEAGAPSSEDQSGFESGPHDACRITERARRVCPLKKQRRISPRLSARMTVMGDVLWQL